MIIGAHKSGSTALARQLAAHPQVYLPKAETRYFHDPWFQFEDEAVLSRAVATTRSGIRRRGIKGNNCLAGPACARRIRETLGAVDLLAILREPVDRAISAYFWGMRFGFVPLAPAEVGLSRLLDGQIGSDYPTAAQYILDFGLYGKHLNRYLNVFAREKVEVLLDEELRHKRDATLRRAFAFLGVKEDVPLAQSPRSVNEGIYSPIRLKLQQSRHKYILREFPSYPGRYLQQPRGLWPRIADRSIVLTDRLLLAQFCDNSRPTIDPRLRQRLARYYRADILALQEIIGRDLSSWLHRHD